MSLYILEFAGQARKIEWFLGSFLLPWNLLSLNLRDNMWWDSRRNANFARRGARVQKHGALLYFIDLRVRKIRNEASSCLEIFSRTLRVYYVSPGLPLLHLLDQHRDVVGSSAFPAGACTEPVRYPWGSIVELEVPPDKTPGLMTLHLHNTNVLQSITYAKSPYPLDISNMGQKNQCFRHEYGQSFQSAYLRSEGVSDSLS